MSFGSRLKNRRKEFNLKQSELGKKLGVTGAAVANYENDINTPRTETLYKIFDVLHCDANYLFQEEVDKPKIELTDSEVELVKKYRTLDQYGKETVDSVLEIEHKRYRNIRKLPTAPISPIRADIAK